MRLTQASVVKALDQVYGKAVEGVPGVPGLESAERLAQDYLDGTGSLEKMVDTLIRYQVAKASASGFLTGLGGIVALPVTLPTNLVSVMYIQLQTVTAIAYMGGHDVRNDRVKTVCYACLCGNAATDVLKGAGITVGVKMTEQAIRRLSFEAIKKVNQAVGFRLVTKFGQTGVVNLGKAVPLVGGVVGGAFDGTTTYVNGKVAKKLFIGVDDPQATRAPETERWDIPEDLSELWSPEEKTRRNLPESDGRI